MCALYPTANPIIVAKKLFIEQPSSIITTMYTPSCVNTHTHETWRKLQLLSGIEPHPQR